MRIQLVPLVELHDRVSDLWGIPTAHDAAYAGAAEHLLPPVADETDATYLVGGTTAAAIDFSDAVADRLLVFVAVVPGL